MESKAEDDFIWSEDRAIVNSPGSRTFLVPNCSTSGNAFLPLVIQPLLAIDPQLKNVVQTALQSSDAVSSLQGGLSRHQIAAVWMLLHSSEWQETYQRLQNSLIKNDKEGLDPLLPYLKLLNGALELLPKLRGNLWYYCDKDVHDLYRTGTVFNWSGFLRCKFQSEIILDENNLQTVKTIFCIQTSSGRIVVPFSRHANEYIPVVISPNTFFQVISVSQFRGNIFLIGQKEIHSPYALEPRSSPISDPDAERPSQQYWDKLLQKMDPLTASAIFLSVQNIARATANVPLYCLLLQRLSEMSSFQYTNAESALVFSTNLKEMKRFPCYVVVQLFGSAVLNALYSDEEFKTSPVVDKEVQAVVLEAIHNHKESKGMTQAGLKLLVTLINSFREIDQPQQMVDIVLSTMKYHSEDNDIQTQCCSLLDSLSQNSQYVSFITERQGRDVILNTIRIHRSEKVVHETCWRILLRLVRHNNINNCTGDGNQDTQAESFFEVLKNVLKAYRKTTSIQAEGLTTLMEALVHSAKHASVDNSYLELLITAMRTHGSVERIVDCSFGILVEFTKSSKLTKLLMDQEALTCILSAMNHHFNAANIQENGCKLLRNIALNGCRGYRKGWDIIFGIPSPISSYQENLFDFRLKIVESGGIDVIISAMKTHSNHSGCQREGCLAIQTLSVNANKVVESREQEDVRVVLATFSKISSSETLKTAALRTLATLAIHPLNREFIILNGGVEYALSALREYPDCGHILGAGVATLTHLSKVTHGALSILHGNGLQLMVMLLESEVDNGAILASACTVLANLCSLPLHDLKADDGPPIDIMCETGGYHCVTDLMNKFPENLQLQKESYRVICTLPRVFYPRLVHYVDAITQTVFKSAQNVSEDVDLLSLRCRAVGRVITFFSIIDTGIPDQVVDGIVSMMQQYRMEIKLIRECCITLSIMTTSSPRIARRIFYKDGVICMLNCFNQHQSDKQIVVPCLKILSKMTSTGSTRLWELLNPFQTPLSELIRQQIVSADGIETLLEVLTNNVENRYILLLAGVFFMKVFSSQERVTDTNIVARINTLITDIRNYYSEEDFNIRLFCGDLSHLVNP